MENNALLQSDLDHVEALAFKRMNILKNCLNRVHVLRADPQHAAHYEVLDQLRALLRRAYTLYADDFKGVTDHVCEEIKAGRSIHPALLAGLKHFSHVQTDSVHDIIAACEWNQSKGDFDDFLTPKGKDKARAAQERFDANPEANADLEAFKARHPEFAKKRGVLTRTLMMERNRKPDDFKFENTPDGLAQFELNGLAFKWTLWGLEKGKMLLHKLTVTVSPWGIDIFIPRFWSLDWKRDLNWKAILKFLLGWGNERQGEKRHLSQMEAKARNKRIYLAYEEGKATGKQGDELQRYVEEKVGVRPMDEGNFRRSVRLGKQIVDTERKATE